MSLFDKSKKELEIENKILRELLSKQSREKTSVTKVKKVMYQCRYCGYRSVRNATDGAPLTISNCPKHPRGWCKGLHSWMRTYL